MLSLIDFPGSPVLLFQEKDEGGVDLGKREVWWEVVEGNERGKL